MFVGNAMHRNIMRVLFIRLECTLCHTGMFIGNAMHRNIMRVVFIRLECTLDRLLHSFESSTLLNFAKNITNVHLARQIHENT